MLPHVSTTLNLGTLANHRIARLCSTVLISTNRTQPGRRFVLGTKTQRATLSLLPGLRSSPQVLKRRSLFVPSAVGGVLLEGISGREPALIASINDAGASIGRSSYSLLHSLLCLLSLDWSSSASTRTSKNRLADRR